MLAEGIHQAVSSDDLVSILWVVRIFFSMHCCLRRQAGLQSLLKLKMVAISSSLTWESKFSWMCAADTDLEITTTFLWIWNQIRSWAELFLVLCSLFILGVL